MGHNFCGCVCFDQTLLWRDSTLDNKVIVLQMCCALCYFCRRDTSHCFLMETHTNLYFMHWFSSACRNEVWRYQPCFKPIPWWRYIFRGFPMGAGLFVVAVGLEKLFSKDDGHGHHWPWLHFTPSDAHVHLVRSTSIEKTELWLASYCPCFQLTTPVLLCLN